MGINYRSHRLSSWPERLVARLAKARLAYDDAEPRVDFVRPGRAGGPPGPLVVITDEFPPKQGLHGHT